MPISTRSTKVIGKAMDDSTQNHKQVDVVGRNPQEVLKEKMKALTLLYEQQKRAFKDKEHIPSNLRHPPSPISDDFKENAIPLQSAVARKLSMGTSIMSPSKNENLERQSESLAGAGHSRIHVFVRLRPMSKKEKDSGSKCCVRIVNKRDIYLTEFSNENDYLRLKRVRGRHFTFDASFPDSSSQHEIYSKTTAEVVEGVLSGKNGSVFCYGATGAGKTYTMLGTAENPGVMVLAIKDLFSKLRQRCSGGYHVVHLSYLEVYNETVRDLLSPGRPLVLRQDKNQGIVAAGLTQYRAYSTDEVMALLQQGNLNRTTEPTHANATSSRSHAILQVVVEYQIKDGSNNAVSRAGKLSLIDLAGSERALATDKRTLRLLEGANINKSLLALSSSINSLVEGKKHIPYRNSKLTQLLKDSLGGACNTVMIANISPSSLSFSETQNTLHWADRAKEIRNKDCDVVNEEVEMVAGSGADQTKLLLELQKENRELRMELARQQQKLMTVEAQVLAATTPNKKQKPKACLLSGKGDNDDAKTIKALEAEIEKLNKDHALQMKHKDNLINELSRKAAAQLGGAKSHLKNTATPEGDLKRAGHRFLSPAPTAKKRSFWDITTTANSPSVAMETGRKARSHVPTARPSMLPQPGFARKTLKKPC